MLLYLLVCAFFIGLLPMLDRNIYLFSMISVRVSVDRYTISFLEVLFLISFAVMVWSKYYIQRDIDHNRFLLLIIAFIIRMAIIIIFSNMYMALIGWDCLGVTSFLLVIFYKNRKRLGSGIITALSNRIGDCFFLCLLGFLCVDRYLCLILLIMMRITKRAQFPFSGWLPAAIAAPTPVRALVHSSTLVTAGVYMIIRYCNLDSGPMISIGRFTILIAGLRACSESDLKKVVALRTLSQLGVMMVALGAGEKNHGFHHMISHACFKALIFICIGTSLHSVYGTQDGRRFNKTYTLFIAVFLSASVLSLLGFMYLSGYERKEIILEMTYKANSCAILRFLLGVGLTTCYSVKIMTLLFGFDFTLNRCTALGGFKWTVKAPMYSLGFLSLRYGQWWMEERLLFPGNGEKIMPLVFILLGLLLGFFLPRINNKFLRRIITLIPNTQHLASNKMRLQIDKGWLEAKSYLCVHPFLIEHFTPLIAIGISILLIWLYGQCC